MMRYFFIILLLLDVRSSIGSGEAPVCTPTSVSGNCGSGGVDRTNQSTDQEQQWCGLYLAPDMHDNTLLSLYAGVPRNSKERIGEPELVLPIIDPNKNEYSPWHDYVWKPNFLPKELIEPYKYKQNLFVSGIGSLVSCSGETKANVFFDDKVKKDCDAMNTSDSNHGAISCYDDFGVSAIEDLEAGEEIVIDCSRPTNQKDSKKAKMSRNVASMDWLEEKGACFDTLSVAESSIPGAGRGAFSKMSVSEGDVISVSPVIHFDQSQNEILKQEKKTVHKVPLYRDHGIEYTSQVVGEQLMKNYVYGHPDSNVVLLPVAPGVNFINHNDEPNAYIRWSTKLGNSKKVREKLPVMELFESGTLSLVIEFVALRDISPGEEIFIDYGESWKRAWENHVEQRKLNPTAENVFRHEIGVPDSLFPKNWMRHDPDLIPDFIANPLKPGYMAPVRWRDTQEVVTPWGFRMGLDKKIRETLLEYCKRLGIIDIMEHVTKEGNGLEPGTETHMDLNGSDWYLQRPAPKWRSNLHWFSPGGNPAHEDYLQALSIAGFDEVLKSLGEYLAMDGLAVFHVTFIACSHSTKGYMHHDMTGTGRKAYNIIVPLILANETGPELDLEDIDSSRIGRYQYEYDVAGFMGDDSVHGTSAVDYRPKKEMRLAATIYVADFNEDNVDSVMSYFTQAYPPLDRDLMLDWAGRHWRNDDPTRALPKPGDDHILLQPNLKLQSTK